VTPLVDYMFAVDKRPLPVNLEGSETDREATHEQIKRMPWLSRITCALVIYSDSS
jgi:hypothetical protein